MRSGSSFKGLGRFTSLRWAQARRKLPNLANCDRRHAAPHRDLIETTVAYATDREAFGRPIGKFQAIRHHVAEMATKAEASRALTYNALRLFRDGHDCIQEVSMAKLMTQRAVLEIADQSLQIHGGYGHMREYGIERAVRDARLGRSAAGRTR
jgi:alkylation response protein AidB-like acyl-CoA dehydrogenase